jgi:hypothetical protein
MASFDISIPPRNDLVIDPGNVWLVIHESIGHPTGTTGIPEASASHPTPVRPRYRRPCGPAAAWPLPAAATDHEMSSPSSALRTDAYMGTYSWPDRAWMALQDLIASGVLTRSNHVRSAICPAADRVNSAVGVHDLAGSGGEPVG